jgi:acetyl esterase
MAVDAQAQAFLGRVAAAGRPAFHTLTPEDARREYRQTRAYVQPAKPEVASVSDRAVPALHGSIPVRYYRPLHSKPDDFLPVLVYSHGGGHTIGCLETHDTLCRELSNRTPCAVIAVHYRLAPEHKFPAAVEDCIAATRWVAAAAATLGVDARRIAVGGDSAGANLAAVTALALRDSGGPELRFQMLVYPITDQFLDTPSHKTFAEGYLLTRNDMLYYRRNYLRGPDDYGDWRASPQRAGNFSRLPAALVITAGFDPLCDEGKAYADALAAVGVPVSYTCYEGMIHGFFMMGGIMDAANEAVAQAAAALAKAFSLTYLDQPGVIPW